MNRRDKVVQALTEVLDGQEALHCTRVWEGWSYGTMSENDFSRVADDQDALEEIADAVLLAIDGKASK